MADSIPALRRKLDEANAEIAKLKAAQPAEVVVERKVYVDREVKVPGPERVVYVDREVHIAGPERIVEVVQVVKEKGDTKIVEVPVEVEKTVHKRVETEKVVYVDNPEHLRTIELLQERLAECQNISQSDSL